MRRASSAAGMSLPCPLLANSAPYMSTGNSIRSQALGLIHLYYMAGNIDSISCRITMATFFNRYCPPCPLRLVQRSNGSVLAIGPAASRTNTDLLVS
ncbi:hypothetical protein M431DRAFT_451507 [Trichoderma harzianum CBS 226.95]|uniref:Uncharacterized protein n=1 Tax=Trichoderma harzianum CBS 226.95 TaxID=983964 RepID=A0A2T4AAN7_TRIHA|nr:hypothetical protein M431DRAFT_451507 [Trichoderma harzianum CBS 226.95]PTB54154.1 hypothetical protein M431DRAFT_451507 [Trichoderma harzianum CBS 226.95]